MRERHAERGNQKSGSRASALQKMPRTRRKQSSDKKNLATARVQRSHLRNGMKLDAGDSLGHRWRQHSDSWQRDRQERRQPGKNRANRFEGEEKRRTTAENEGGTAIVYTNRVYTHYPAKLTVYLVSGRGDCQAHTLWNQRVLVEPRMIRWVGMV